MPTISPRLALARDLTRCAALEVDGTRVAMEHLAARVYQMSDATFEDDFLTVIAAREALFRDRGGPRERFYPDRRPPVDPHTFLPIREPDPDPEPLVEPDPEPAAPTPLQPSRRVRALSVGLLAALLLITAFVIRRL